jgi:hypothetical protein
MPTLNGFLKVDLGQARALTRMARLRLSLLAQADLAQILVRAILRELKCPRNSEKAL